MMMGSGTPQRLLRATGAAFLVGVLSFVVFLNVGKEYESIELEGVVVEQTSCASDRPYHLKTFDRAGKMTHSKCAETVAVLLAHMLELEPQESVVTMALGSEMENVNDYLEDMANIVVDDFLAPRFEWRLVAERFRYQDDAYPLLYDPAIFAPEGTNTFAEPATAARQTLLRQDPNGNNMLRFVDVNKNRNDGEALLKQLGMDFVLVRVLDDKLVALSSALRRHQFPDDCRQLDQQSLGRTMVFHGGHKDFLGAMTSNNVGHMSEAIKRGLPFVLALPPIWGQVYHFNECHNANGFECAFLPIYGGKCLEAKIQPALECMAKFKMGGNENVVLPRNGIPLEVCEESHRQLPEQVNITWEDYRPGGPPEAFKEWCPQCGFGAKVQTASPDLLNNSTAPLTFGELPVPANSETCAMDLRPLQCGGTNRTCCSNEVMIPKHILQDQGSEKKEQEEAVMSSALSSFLTRFNRASRRRIARLHYPRVVAMNARNQGWESAMATGNCATLHIRRGDNIDRCKEGETSFCSMNLTLADYMNKAVPMLAQLNQSKHVFVMTDDSEVVAEDKIAPWREKGYIIETSSGYNQWSKETYDDWDTFLESLYTAQACRAVVGHYISTVSKLVYRSMCARWGECPIDDMMRDHHQR